MRCLILLWCVVFVCGVMPLSVNGKQTIDEDIYALAATAPNTIFPGNKTFLARACENQDVELVRILLSSGADVNASNDTLHPIIIAAKAGNTEILRLLVAAQADITASDSTGATALLTAVYKNHTDATRLLLRAGADPNILSSVPNEALPTQVENLLIVESLLEARADPNLVSVNGISPLLLAVVSKRNDIAIMLVKHGADANRRELDGITPLAAACYSDLDDVVKAILEHGAEDIETATPLLMAVARNSSKSVKLLLDYGADASTTNEGLTALLTAVYKNQTDNVRDLLRAGVDPNIKSLGGKPPLYAAVEVKNPYIVENLLDAHADPNMMSADMSPLIVSIFSNQSDIAITLVKRGSDVNRRELEGINPLLAACYSGLYDVVKALLKHGANINTQDIHNNNTALMVALGRNNTKIVELLLSYGADASITNSLGQTALGLARANQKHDMIELLLADRGRPKSMPISNIVISILVAILLVIGTWEEYKKRQSNRRAGSTVSLHGPPNVEEKSIERLKEAHRDFAIKYSELNIAEYPIKKSSNAHIYCGVYRARLVAIKMIRNEYIDETELMILSTLRHSRILVLLGVVQDLNPRFGAELGLVTEYMPRGSLYDVLHSTETPPEHRLTTLPAKLRVLKDVADGMNFLHDNNVIHKDLKSPNVLLDCDGRAKICDFGVSRVLSVNTTHTSSLGGGTVRWMAPEAFTDRVYVSFPFDIYSFGVIMWEVLTTSVPWLGLEDHQIIPKVSRGERLVTPSMSANCPGYVVSLLEECLESNYSIRPSFAYLSEMLDVFLRHCTRKSSEASYFHEFLCPISHEMMRDPVMCSDGHTYERDHIEEWFKDHDTSPMTNVVLEDQTLRPNICLRKIIQEYAEM